MPRSKFNVSPPNQLVANVHVFHWTQELSCIAEKQTTPISKWKDTFFLVKMFNKSIWKKKSGKLQTDEKDFSDSRINSNCGCMST